jgi:hypothetical protein
MVANETFKGIKVPLSKNGVLPHKYVFILVLYNKTKPFCHTFVKTLKINKKIWQI